MPKYNLGFYNKNNSITIDLTNIFNFKTLEELDNFTSNFKNETELKIYLVKKGILYGNYVSKNINVIYKNEGTYKKIPVLYLDNKKYVDIEYLKNKLLSMSGNLEFLEKLANRMDSRKKHNIQGTNIAAIRTHLINIRGNGDPSETYDLLFSALSDMFYKAVISSPNKKTREVKISYRGLRDLGLFVAKYDKIDLQNTNVNETVEIDELDQVTYDDYLMEENEYSEEDSYSVSYDELLTQDGSPFFPPNSEEERRYRAYVESNDKNFNKNIDTFDEFYPRRKR